VIIFLNGTSSSGKSSIAAELLKVLDTPYFLMAVDAFGAMRSVKRTLELDGPELTEVLRRTRAGFHRAVAGMAHAGNDLVVDHVLSEPWRLQDCLTVLDGLDVVFVGVHCPPEELERRERARGDRVPGVAAKQLQSVHQHGLYDFEVDTSVSSPRECAEAVKESLARPPRAFEELRRR
jgi:chloramphenicol 3-O phosphotransferase